MTRHELPATAETAVDVFDRSLAPVLEIEAGDTVVVGALDAHGFVGRPSRGADGALEGERLLPDLRGHCLTGPIAVRGAEPGSVLAVRIGSVEPGEWGWTSAGGRDTGLERALGVARPPVSSLLWDVDASAGIATDERGRRIGLAPFLGVIGLAPAVDGEHSTIPPRQGSGGNIDCRDLVAGSTLFLPVRVPGALLSVGDGHAVQGHGEVGGTALECPTTSVLTVDVVDAGPVAGIHADTGRERIVFGFDADLNAATAEALNGMLDLLVAELGVDRAEALALASVAVDLHVTQVANRTWGVHASLPHAAAGSLGLPVS